MYERAAEWARRQCDTALRGWRGSLRVCRVVALVVVAGLILIVDVGPVIINQKGGDCGRDSQA